jgi:hypothetical protein
MVDEPTSSNLGFAGAIRADRRGTELDNPLDVQEDVPGVRQVDRHHAATGEELLVGEDGGEARFGVGRKWICAGRGGRVDRCRRVG